MTINRWLRANGDAPAGVASAAPLTLPLPTVCGYAPMLSRIYDKLRRYGL